MEAKYDYIVVGAGSAGAVLTNRLVKSGAQVLLIEAGPKDTNPMIHMPGGAQEVIKSKKHNWYLDSLPQKNLNGRRLMQHRGKMLGGSSNLNGMVCIRGHKACYDHWAELGNTQWSYDNVLPHFKAIENWCGTENDYHGSQGELPINLSKGENPLFDRFIEAGKSLGLPQNDDFNGEDQYGVGRYHVNIHQGQRYGTSKAFLKPIQQAHNLTIMTNTEVEKIIFEGKRASAVKAIKKGKKPFIIKANREIILSAGALKSPQLLMVSGVGPADLLSQQGIPLVHELSGVGQNLQDHLSFLFNYPCSEPITLNGIVTNPLKKIKVGIDYFLFKKGVGAENSLEAGAFWRSNAELSAPDVQFHFMPGLMYNMTDTLPSQHGVSVRACNLNPYSRGSISIASASGLDDPLIDFNFLGDDRDIDVLLNAFHLTKKWMANNAWGGILGKETKGADDAQTEAQVIDYIREYIETDYHPVGTCKMGLDEEAVVDQNLKVVGIEGLRVADASIMPTIVRGNTNLPCMMIGDKAASLIL